MINSCLRCFKFYQETKMSEENIKNMQKASRLGGGPLRYGDPDDKTLRKTERDIILPNMIRERATEKCPEAVGAFLKCAKEAGLFVIFKCRVENKIKNDCVVKWAKNQELVKEVTEEYLEARSHYRRTGKPLRKYDRVKTFSSVEPKTN